MAFKVKLTNLVNDLSTNVLATQYVGGVNAINRRQYREALRRVAPDINAYWISSEVPINVIDAAGITVVKLHTNADRAAVAAVKKSVRPSEHIIQNPEKRYTLVYELNQVRHGELHVKVAAARASVRDNFSRKLGRTIATGRLKADKVQSFIVDGNIPTNGNEWRALESYIRTQAETKFR